MKILFGVQKLFIVLAMGVSLLATDIPNNDTQQTADISNEDTQQVPDIPKDYKQIECVLAPINRDAHHQTHPNIPLNDKLIGGYSTNWGGYVAETNLSNPAARSVTAAYGSWIVPSIKRSTNNSYCAIWAGIDGYSSPTVEQIGTGHDWINGVVQHYAWFEMYPRNAYIILNFPVYVGNVISASVTYTRTNVFTLRLYNHTKRVVYTVPTSYTTMSAQRKSAEWIVEAPYLNGILPLANFGTIDLLGCIATINGITGVIHNPAWANSSITMVTNNTTPKAIPSVLNPDSSFSMAWKHQ